MTGPASDADSKDDTDDLTRNLNELLQEVRVAQTGVTLLTGFLLTLPFTDRFGDLSDLQRGVFLAVLLLSVLTTGLLVAPAALHRMVFHQHMRRWLVSTANLCARLGLLSFAFTSAGVVFFVFDVVISQALAWVAGLGTLAVLLGLWVLLPTLARERRD